MNKKLYSLMNWPLIEEIVYAESKNPQNILGPQIKGNSTLLQVFVPGATKVSVKLLSDASVHKMDQADEEGFFVTLLTGKKIGKYVLLADYEDKTTKEIVDPYQFPMQTSDKALQSFSQGINYEIYNILGAHPMTVDGIEGVNFAVWAPNAVRVSVVGDFNNWDGRAHQMMFHEEAGVFELFIPGVEAGACYKYEIKGKGGAPFLKADPYAFGQQLRPDTASVVTSNDAFDWEDSKWMNKRKKLDAKKSPISVYELYLGSFAANEDGSYMNYRDLAPKIISYVKEMGYTHIELMPVMEHPFDGSWGYQVIGYYAPTARYGTKDDFKFFMNEMHKAGIGVILDWVPAHFPRDQHGLAVFDGTCLYEHQDPRQGSHPHWGTLIYNYGRPEVKNYLIANALYWVEEYHADGIRMDAVASMLYLDYGKQDGEWVANIYGGNENLDAVEFLKHLNSVMKKRNDGVLMIAEESTAWPKVTGDLEDDGLGFDIKWNMGWMNDYLRYISQDPYFRSGCHNDLTFSMIYCYSENFMLVFSHDEVVHGKSSMIGKMPGNREEQFANLRLTYAYMMAHPGKKLIFMGQDVGEFEEWNEERTVNWNLLKYDEHKNLNRLVADLNKLYQKMPALHAFDDSNDGFEWINCISPEKCMLSFMRKGKKKEDTIVVVANFANAKQTFHVGVPYEGKYEVLLHTDDKKYSGSGLVPEEPLFVQEREVDDKPYCIEIEMAPLSICFLTYAEYTEADETKIAIYKAEVARRLKEEKQEMIKHELEKLESDLAVAATNWRKYEQEQKQIIAAKEQAAKNIADELKVLIKEEEEAKKKLSKM